MKSPMYDELKKKYELGYVNVEQLKRRVVLARRKPDKGITEEEYEEITGEPYEE